MNMSINRKVALAAATTVFLVGSISASAGNASREGFRHESDTETRIAFQQFLQSQGGGAQAPSVLFPHKGHSLQCLAQLAICAGGATGTVLSCVADLFTGGAMTPECLAAMAATSGACATASQICGGHTGSPAHVRLALTGSATTAAPDTTVTLGCPSHHRVKTVKTEWFGENSTSGRISRLTMTCTNGTNLVFGYAGTGSYTQTCPTGDLVAGLMQRVGTEINAAGVGCQQTAQTGAPIAFSPLRGGAGGTTVTRTCAAGKYVRGARVHMDGSTESNRNIRGIELDCR
jgi:hypothetical protein